MPFLNKHSGVSKNSGSCWCSFLFFFSFTRSCFKFKATRRHKRMERGSCRLRYSFMDPGWNITLIVLSREINLTSGLMGRREEQQTAECPGKNLVHLCVCVCVYDRERECVCVGERTRQIPCYYNLGRFDHSVGQIAIYASARYISDTWARVTLRSPISLRLPLFSSLLSPSPSLSQWSWLYWQKLSSGEVGCSPCADTLVAGETGLKLWARGGAGLCSAAEKQQHKPVVGVTAYTATLITIHTVATVLPELCVSVSPRSTAPSLACRRISRSGWRCFCRWTSTSHLENGRVRGTPRVNTRRSLSARRRSRINVVSQRG